MVIYFAGNFQTRNIASFQFKAPKRIARKYRVDDAFAKAVDNQLYNSGETKGKRVNIQNGKVNTNQKRPTTVTPKTVNSVKKVSKIGSFLSKNKVSLGIGVGVLASGLIANQVRKSITKKQNFFNKKYYD